MSFNNVPKRCFCRDLLRIFAEIKIQETVTLPDIISLRNDVCVNPFPNWMQQEIYSARERNGDGERARERNRRDRVSQRYPETERHREIEYQKCFDLFCVSCLSFPFWWFYCFNNNKNIISLSIKTDIPHYDYKYSISGWPQFITCLCVYVWMYACIHLYSSMGDMRRNADKWCREQ